jgi:hypothetical protein
VRSPAKERRSDMNDRFDKLFYKVKVCYGISIKKSTEGR